jgi:predicted signal transduction protein with EAL and GGDEF domain
LRLGVATLTIEGVGVSITASVGVASFPEDGASLPTLFATADARRSSGTVFHAHGLRCGNEHSAGWRSRGPALRQFGCANGT